MENNISVKTSYDVSSDIAYQQSIEFFEAAKQLDNIDDLYMTATVVNGTFACELLLKALLMRNKKTTEFKGHKIHSIIDLYDSLDDLQKIDIRKRSKIVLWDIFMNDINNAFKDWRYINETYQTSSISLYDIFRFYSALKAEYEKTFETREGSIESVKKRIK